MPLVIEDETNTSVAGTAIATHLQAELAAHAANSVPGAALLNPIMTGGEDYKIVIKSDSVTATSGKRVSIDLKEVKIDRAAALADLKEFVESAIFELSNASNSATFAPLETQLQSGALSVRTYGRRKADLEAEASWNLADIITQNAAYTPSAFGKGHVDAVGGAALAAFQTSFRSAPHDRTATAGTQQALPSEEYYAFLGAYTVAGMSKKFDNQFTAIKHRKAPGGNLSIAKLMTVGLGTDANRINKVSNTAPIFYHVVVDLMNTHADVVVTWKTSYADCAFTPAMRTVATDAGNAMKNKLSVCLSNKAKDLIG